MNSDRDEIDARMFRAQQATTSPFAPLPDDQKLRAEELQRIAAQAVADFARLPPEEQAVVRLQQKVSFMRASITDAGATDAIIRRTDEAILLDLIERLKNEQYALRDRLGLAVSALVEIRVAATVSWGDSLVGNLAAIATLTSNTLRKLKV